MTSRQWNYADITETAEKQINGLMARSRALGVDPDGRRFFEDCAYGAYLLWNTLTLAWQKDGDDTRLKALARDRKPGT